MDHKVIINYLYGETSLNNLKKYTKITHDDRFWALALAVYAAEQAPPPPSRPIARVI